MLTTNPLFEKDSLKEAISTIGQAAFTLIYDANDLPEQINAGKELLQAKWILATISDHIFDYYPISYFMNDEDKKEYPKYWQWFLEHPTAGINKAIRFVEDNFCMLESVTRDELNQHRIPRRDLDKEKHVREVLQEVSLNSNEILKLLHGEKNKTDKGRPSEEEIRKMIEAINKLQKQIVDYSDKLGGEDSGLRAFQLSQVFEVFKNPLYMAWQVYNYGWHSDFWKEGDSMFEYIMFEMKAKETIESLIKTLEEQSPFSQIENCSVITNGLLHIYRHMLTQDLKNY